MQTRQSVKDIEAGQEVQSIFLLGAATLQQSRNGPFWRLELRDATGSVDAKIWSPISLEHSDLSAGQMVQVEGRAQLFREQVQITVERLRVLSPEEMAQQDMRHFMLASPYPVAEMWESLMALCKKELTHAPWAKLMRLAFKDEEIQSRFCSIPAAKGVHHAYVGGLLEHTLSVAGMAMRAADHYPHLDRQVLLMGALFHDMGKIWEFSGGLVNDYTDDGRLLGHMELVLEYLGPLLEKAGVEPPLARHLKHLILSHHGLPEYGSARLPQTPEALALHYVDNLDAKMGQCQSLFSDWEEGQSGWTSYQSTLGRFMHQPMRTPRATPPMEKPARPRKPAPEEQCLSLLKV